jgi:hypothetical protein
MIRSTVRAARVAAVLVVSIILSAQAAWLAAVRADDDSETPAKESTEGKPKPGIDRYAKAVRTAFALPKGLTYSQLSKDQQNKLDDLRTQKEPDLREALEALQEAHGSKDNEARHKVDDVRKDIRTGIDEILAAGGSAKDSQPGSGSKYPSSGSPPPAYPEQPPGYGYPGYYPPNYYGPGWPSPYYPWGYGPGWGRNRYPGQSSTSQNPPAKPASTPPKPQPKPQPHPHPQPKSGGGSR